MIKLLKLSSIALLLIALVPQLVLGTNFFVAPDGQDAGDGTLSDPFATIDHATSDASPGDTVFVRGGTYERSSSVRPQENGSENNYIYIVNYQDEVPVYDFSGMDIDGSNRGWQINRDYVYVKGIIIEYAGDNGLNIAGNNNVIEKVVTRYNADSGLQMAGGAGGNLILNCDSYENYDPQNNGENADGFAAKFDLTEGNVFRGCRAWGNSDDGWDFWEAGNGVEVENCWSFSNGHNIWGDGSFDGDGNGYKFGHGAGAHVIKHSISVYNAKHGYDVNGNETGVHVYNTTGYSNGGDNFYFDEHSNIHQMRNNISYDGGLTVYEEIDDQYNTWNGNPASSDDFASLDSTGLTGPRDADGSLPTLNFLRLSENSDLIDAGVDVGLDYDGDAPDLGAFEYDPTIDIEPEQTHPELFALYQNYPNPFNATTEIRYYLPNETPVKIDIYDVHGSHIMTVENTHAQAGTHTVQWNGINSDGETVGTGVYLYRIRASRFTQIRKMTLLK